MGYPPIMDKLKALAFERGLWNLFLPHLNPANPGYPMSNLDYAPISETLGDVCSLPPRRSTAPRPTRATWRILILRLGHRQA